MSEEYSIGQWDELRAENEILRRGLKGDFDLDAWLGWAKERASMQLELEQALLELNSAVFEGGQLRDRVGELETQYQRDVYGLNNEGDPIGGEPAGGYANDNRQLRANLAALAKNYDDYIQVSMPMVERYQKTSCELVAMRVRLVKLEDQLEDQLKTADSACAMSIIESKKLRAELAEIGAKNTKLRERISDRNIKPCNANNELAAIKGQVKSDSIQEPFAWSEFDGEGGYDLRLYEGSETFRDDFITRNGGKYADWVQPLYAAPAPSAAVMLAGVLAEMVVMMDCGDERGRWQCSRPDAPDMIGEGRTSSESYRKWLLVAGHRP